MAPFSRYTLLYSAIMAASLPMNGWADDSDESEVEMVVVYGEKQEKSVQDTVTSVAVMNAEALERAPIFNIRDIFARTANVNSMNEGNNRTDFAIRGVRLDGVTGSGNGRTAAVFVDGAALGAEAVNYGGLGVWDLEQVEIFRGPQGTLQGRNTLMGAIVAKTKDPTFEPDGAAQLQVGQFNTRRYSVAYGQGLNDQLAFRVSLDRHTTDGEIDNVTRNDDRHDYSDRKEVRAKLLWEPSDSLQLKLTMNRMETDVGSGNTVRDDDPHSFEALSDVKDRNRTRATATILETSYDLNDQLSLTLINSRNWDEYDRMDDYESAAVPGNFIDQTYGGLANAHELRFNLETSSVSAVGGVYLSNSRRTTDYNLRNIYQTSLFRNQAVNVYTTQYGLDDATAGFLYDTYMPGTVPVDYTSLGTQWTKNRALFGELTLDLNYQWSVTAGIRYDREDMERVDGTVLDIQSAPETNTNPVAPGVPITVADLVNGTLAAFEQTGGEAPLRSDATYSAWLPKAVVSYHVSDDMSVSVLAQKGYRAGGAVKSLSTGAVVEFDPEFTWNYELSMRSQWLDRRLTLNANVYYIDWTDQQVEVSQSGDPQDRVTVNAGESVLKGLELEVRAQIRDSLMVYGSYGYSRTRFEKFNTLAPDGSGVNYAGNEFRLAPRHTANAGLELLLRSLTVSGDVSYQGGHYTQNDNKNKTDSRWLFNGRVAYQLNDVEVSAWGTNLTNRKYVTSTFDRNTVFPEAQDTVYLGAPRTLGAGVKYSF